MFDNIGEKIKILAKTIGILGTVVGVIVFIYAFVSYSENAEYEKYLYEYSYSFLQDAAVAAVAAKTTMKWSAALALTSIVSCWPLYGFGQLIENSTIIAEHYRKENEGQTAQKAIEAELPEL